MHFNRYDIIQAHYWFTVYYHGGQWSELYERQCRISKYYTPGVCENGPEGENAQAIYDALVEAHEARTRDQVSGF
jgi:hypothetical protein